MLGYGMILGYTGTIKFFFFFFSRFYFWFLMFLFVLFVYFCFLICLKTKIRISNNHTILVSDV